MTDYGPGPVPENYQDLRRYIDEELRSIRDSLLTVYGEWYDLLSPIVSAGRRGSLSDFDWTDYNSTGIYQPEFALNEDGIVNFHINHDIKRGSKMYPHVHWSTDGTQTNDVVWELNYIWADRNDATPSTFSALQTLTITGAPSGTAYQHIVSEVSDGAAIDVPDVDAIILMQIKRVTNGGTNNTDAVFGHFVDIHYQRERLGTPNKAPDYYKGL